MNSGEFNKIAGGVIGAVLLFLLLGFASEMLYVGRGHEGDRVLAFAVEVEEAGGGGEAAGPDWGALLASADAGAGASSFNKCKSCHAVEDGQNGVGPHLYGAVGRDIAAVDGYAYSEALMQKEGAWDLENLFGFLHNPGGWAPGTKMGFAGLKDDQDKVNMIAWLNEQSASPIELTAPAGAEPAPAEGEAADSGLDSTDERDAKDAGVESDAAPTKEVDLADEEEAEQKADAAVQEAAESDTRADATYSEQQSGTDELAAAGTEASDGGDGAVDTVAEEDQETAAATDATGAGATGAAAGGEYAALLAAADAGNGEKIFRKCKACHRVEDGGKGVGPHLYDVVGRDIASVEGYSYSDALAAKEGPWTLAHLDAFLADPKAFAEGTKMAFAGIESPQDRIDVITYLNEIGGTPEELGAAAGGTQAAEGSDAPGAQAQATAEEVDQPEVETTAEVEKNPPTTEAIQGTQIEPAAEEQAEEQQQEQAAPAEETATEAPAPAAGGSGEFAPLLATADASNGEKVFRKCKACHKLEESGKAVGPHLHGVVGRDIASVEGFAYSDGLTSKDGSWTLEHLDAFLADPKGWAPGTKMTFPGVRDAQDRIDVITYLNEADGSPEPLGQ